MCVCIFYINISKKEFYCPWGEVSKDNSRKGLMDYIAEDLTEEKKAIAAWNHHSGEEKEVNLLNSGSAAVARLLLTVWKERERITDKEEIIELFKSLFEKTGNRYFKHLFTFKEILKWQPQTKKTSLLFFFQRSIWSWLSSG